MSARGFVGMPVYVRISVGTVESGLPTGGKQRSLAHNRAHLKIYRSNAACFCAWDVHSCVEVFGTWSQ